MQNRDYRLIRFHLKIHPFISSLLTMISEEAKGIKCMKTEKVVDSMNRCMGPTAASYQRLAIDLLCTAVAMIIHFVCYSVHAEGGVGGYTYGENDNISCTVHILPTQAHCISTTNGKRR